MIETRIMLHQIYKNTILIFCSVTCFLFSSCKKDHTCVCGVGVKGVSTTIHATASKARKTCELMEVEYSTVCALE